MASGAKLLCSKYSSPSVLIWKAKGSNFLVVPPEILRETVSYKKKKNT